MSALIEFDEVCKYYQMGDTTVKAADHITMKIDQGRVRRHCRPVGLRQIHLHEHHRLPWMCPPTAPTGLNGRDVGRMNRNELALPSGMRCWALSSSSTTCCPG